MTFLNAKWPRPIVLGVLALAWTVLSQAAPPDEPEEKVLALLKAKPLDPAKGDDELRKLQKERYNTALKELQLRNALITAGRSNPLDGLFDAAGLLLEAELDLAETPAERVAVREKQVELLKEVEKTTRRYADTGSVRVTPADVERVRSARLAAEINLLRARKDTPKPASTAPVVGILGAMTIEVEALEGQLTDKKEQTIQGVRFATGVLKGRTVVVAHSGMGEVNAAMAATLLVEHFQPALVLFTGIAGGVNPDLGPGDIVIGKQTTYYDYGELTPKQFRPLPTVNSLTGKPNPLFFDANAGLLAEAEKAAADLKLAPVKTGKGNRDPCVVTGVIVTGNMFVASPTKSRELRKDFKADATEMEGAAVAQICYQQRVPCLVIRSLSDDAGDQAQEDVRLFAKAAAQNSALLVTGIVARLGSK
jgi:adenosylhomocysteine nucleosidase